jgi:hypothetical protein
MDPFLSSDPTDNLVDLDMNFDFDVGNKYEFVWDYTESNTIEEFLPYSAHENPTS